MNSAALIKLIQEADPAGTREVWLQRDAEGNGYEKLYGVWGNAAVTKDGDVGMASLTAEDCNAGFTNEDIVKGKKIIVLQP